MTQKDDRIQSAVNDSRVKLHIFVPSNRQIWTIVGKGKEHWINPDLEFCSCPGYYFAKLTGKNECYHLKSVQLARQENKVETITFSDDEYSDFISGIISDL